MSGIIKIDITESSQELLELLKQLENREVQQRIQTLYWLKTHQVESTQAIASLIGKHRTTVSRWLSKYRQGGINALLAKGKSSGRNKSLSPQLEKQLIEELKHEEGFSSYKEVQRWLMVVHDVEMSYTGVHKMVRYRLKGKLKVPRPVHTKQDKQAPINFKKNFTYT